MLTFVKFLRRHSLLLGILGLWTAEGHAVTGLSPGARVLIIADNLTVTAHLQQALAALSPLPAVVDFCQTLNTDPGGIQPALNRCGKNIMDYCQVWDMRLDGTGSSSGQVSYDTFTLSGATSDKTLYEAFLRSGGSLYILSENAGIHSRNDNLVVLLNAWSNNGSIPYPDQFSQGQGDFDWFVFPSDPLGFNSTPNTLTMRHTRWPGYVPLGQTGSGRPLSQKLDNGTTWVGAFGFLPQDLTLGAGRVIVDLDWTSWNSEWSTDPAGMMKWAQNAYTWLGNCFYRYNLTKAASVLPPAQVCLGENFQYLLCINNTGANPLLASTTINDTLPGCLSYQSSVPAFNQQSGQYANWLAGAVPAGASYCVTVTVRADSLPPCP